MHLSLDFNLSTPALIFPAISLLMLAYTNRFVVLADLIRSLYDEHKENPQRGIMAQINNLQYRMGIIKKMQIFGAAAFVIAAVSMLCSMISFKTIASILFMVSLVLLTISLFLLLKELSVSIDALTIQLNDIKDDQN